MRQAIQQIIEALNQPLSTDERQSGWTTRMKAGYVPVFIGLLDQIKRGEKPPYFGIVRSLDAYGIGSGDLYERMLRVANETNDHLR